jgi:hypothetical protein
MEAQAWDLALTFAILSLSAMLPRASEDVLEYQNEYMNQDS